MYSRRVVTCTTGEADGWIYLKLELLHYPFSLDLVTFFFYIFTIDLLESFFSFFSKFIAHYRFLVTGHGRSSEQSIRHCATRDAVREMGFRRPFYAA